MWNAENGAEIACLNAHADSVWCVSFSPDGRRILTGSFDKTARVWDVRRTEAIARDPAIVITAALARGIGWRTEDEAADLLMQDAPENLYAAARAQLLDPAKYSAEEITRRERALEETIAALHAPLHPNCYLSPTQFAEKFGLPIPGKAAAGPELDTGDRDAAAGGESLQHDGVSEAGQAEDAAPVQTNPPPVSPASAHASSRRRWPILLGVAAILAIAAVAGMAKIGEIVQQTCALLPR